jgi:hypothetical protein
VAGRKSAPQWKCQVSSDGARRAAHTDSNSKQENSVNNLPRGGVTVALIARIPKLHYRWFATA